MSITACHPQAGLAVQVIAQGSTAPFAAVAQHEHIKRHQIPET
jgi:hypothetical protein